MWTAVSSQNFGELDTIKMSFGGQMDNKLVFSGMYLSDKNKGIINPLECDGGKVNASTLSFFLWERSNWGGQLQPVAFWER